MKWRRTLILLHRDVGYFCFGLTIIYAISGIAVNHREHWDYNYSKELTRKNVGLPSKLINKPLNHLSESDLARQNQDQLVEKLMQTLGRKSQPNNVFWRGQNRLSLFFAPGEQDVVDYFPAQGIVETLEKRPRVFLRQFNLLHLNEPRSAWTYIADIYAILLIFLGVTGIIVVKGRRGIKGRGGIFALIGILVPILALIFL